MSSDFIENLIEALDFERRRCAKGECRLDKWRLNVEKRQRSWEEYIVCKQGVQFCKLYVYNRCVMCVERSMINIYAHCAGFTTFALWSCNVLMCDLTSKHDSTPQSNVKLMCFKFVNWFVFNTMCALFNWLCFCIKSNQCNDRYFYEKNSENEASRK